MRYCIILLICGISSALFSAPALEELAYEGGAFFRIPGEKDYWFQTEDKTGSCFVLYKGWKTDPEKDAVRLYDPKREIQFFLSESGDYYTLSKPHAEGKWILQASGKSFRLIQWTRPWGETEKRSLLWQGGTRLFVQDPRDDQKRTQNFWYQIGPGLTCHRFTEKSFALEPFGIQTVSLESGVVGVEAWKIGTGRTTLGPLVEVGTWFQEKGRKK